MDNKSEGKLSTVPNDETDAILETRPEGTMPLVEVEFVDAVEEYRIWAARRIERETKHLSGIPQYPGGRAI